MMMSRVCLQLKKVHQTKQTRWPHINSAKTADPELPAQFVESIEWTLLANKSVEDGRTYIWDVQGNEGNLQALHQ